MKAVVQNANLKIDVDAPTSADQYEQIAPVGSPGCFSLCGWTNYKIKSPVLASKHDTAASSPKPAVPRPSSPIETTPHCYIGMLGSPGGVRQLTSPARGAGMLSSMSTFRKYVVCAQCKAISSANTDRKAATDPSIHATVPKTQPPEVVQCVVCSKVSAFESQLAKAFFCPGHVDGKSVRYAGLPAECYRHWFKERPMTPDSVQKTHAKRMKILTTLQRQHKLHYHKLKDVCLEICTAFDVATCFVSMADKDLELIVGDYGSMLHFSCFPREIGMCDYTMGSSEQHLCITNVPEDPVFRENPMLQAVKAHFYFGIPVLVDGTAIGAVAVMDVKARTDSLDPAAIELMKQRALMMGSRVSALLNGSRSGFPARIMKRQSRQS